MGQFQVGDIAIALILVGSKRLVTVSDLFPKEMLYVTGNDNSEHVVHKRHLTKCRTLPPTDNMRHGDWLFIESHWEAVDGWTGLPVGKYKVVRPVPESP